MKVGRSHRIHFIDDWNRRHGKRFVYHYTPTHGSWLNQVELWFAIVSRRVLRYANFHSPTELVNAIETFVRHWNVSGADGAPGFQLDEGLKGSSSSIRLFGWPAAMASSVALSQA